MNQFVVVHLSKTHEQLKLYAFYRGVALSIIAKHFHFNSLAECELLLVKCNCKLCSFLLHPKKPSAYLLRENLCNRSFWRGYKFFCKNNNLFIPKSSDSFLIDVSNSRIPRRLLIALLYVLIFNCLPQAIICQQTQCLKSMLDL